MKSGLAQFMVFMLAAASSLTVVAQSQPGQIDPELKAGVDRGFPTSIMRPATLVDYQKRESPLRYSEKTLPGMAGEPAVRVILIEPKSTVRERAGILYIHGGGYVSGSAEAELFFAAPLVEKLKVTLVSVDYRLAPGTPYPGSLRDNYAALKWFYENASRIGVDPKRIAVLGGSAGGGHAAQLSLFARDKGEVPIAFQALLAPMLDDRTGTSTDPGENFGQLTWTRKANHDGWRALLGMEPGSKSVPAGAAPARASDLSKLPPTFISVGALDLFAAEDMDFAQRLMRAGVSTELHVFPGAFHGYEVLVPQAAVSREAMAALQAALVRGLKIDE